MADRATCVMASNQLLEYVGDDLVPALRKVRSKPTSNLVLAFFMRAITTFDRLRRPGEYDGARPDR